MNANTYPKRKQKLVIYVCHPYRNDPADNIRRTRNICRMLVLCGYVPLAPHFYLHNFINEELERELAMDTCLNMVDLCDELWVYGAPTEGMRKEIEYAESIGIEVRQPVKENKNV